MRRWESILDEISRHTNRSKFMRVPHPIQETVKIGAAQTLMDAHHAETIFTSMDSSAAPLRREMIGHRVRG